MESWRTKSCQNNIISCFSDRRGKFCHYLSCSKCFCFIHVNVLGKWLAWGAKPGGVCNSNMWLYINELKLKVIKWIQSFINADTEYTQDHRKVYWTVLQKQKKKSKKPALFKKLTFLRIENSKHLCSEASRLSFCAFMATHIFLCIFSGTQLQLASPLLENLFSSKVIELIHTEV